MNGTVVMWFIMEAYHVCLDFFVSLGHGPPTHSSGGKKFDRGLSAAEVVRLCCQIGCYPILI